MASRPYMESQNYSASVGGVVYNYTASLNGNPISDGVFVPATFDSTGLQAAIDLAEVSGGEVYLPAGDYTQTTHMVIDSPNVALRGSGAATRIISATGSSARALKISAADIEVTGITWVGGVSTEISNECIELLSGATDTIIERNIFTGASAGTGYNTQIRGHSGCTNPRIVNNNFKRVYGTSSGQGYGVQLADVAGGTIHDNVGLQTTTQGRHHVYLSAACSDIGVTSNRFTGGTSALITLYSTTTSIEDINIDNNVLRCLGQGGGTGGAIEMVGKVSECGAAHNVIRDAETYGIKLEGDGSGSQFCNDNAFSNNRIYDSGGSGYGILGASGISIEGGIVKNAGANGIAMASVNGTGTDVTDDCSIKGVTVGGTGHVYAISLSGTGVTVSDNTLVAGSSGTYSGIDPTKRKVFNNSDTYSPQHLFSNGTPNAVVTAPKGSTCEDRTNAVLYINTDGSTTWAAV